MIIRRSVSTTSMVMMVMIIILCCDLSDLPTHKKLAAPPLLTLHVCNIMHDRPAKSLRDDVLLVLFLPTGTTGRSDPPQGLLCL